MKISIILPAFNEEKILGPNLREVTEASRLFEEKGWEIERIVCDNNSTDRTAGIARAEGFQVVFEPINQIGRARNGGAGIATGDWFIFIDADSIPTRELFESVFRAIQGGRHIGGGSTIYLDQKVPYGQGTVRVWNTISRVFRLAAGSFIFCRADAFRAVGGFSDKLYASEELDLCKKLKAFGRKEKKGLVIFSHAPLRTSARKAHLYSSKEHFFFILKALLRPGKVLTDKNACFTWYDGRR